MITIEKADKTNFRVDSLDDFIRRQAVKNVYRCRSSKLSLELNPFTEDWSPERKREKAAEILSGEYITYCAFEENRVIGLLMLMPKLNEGRMIVRSFHVSADRRRRGLGRMLFQAAKREARLCGADALYISACSAEETINFYLAMGCRPSRNPIPEMAEDEPCDIQMECDTNES